MIARAALAGLLSDLIRAASPDPPGDERRIVRVLAKHMRRLGLEPEIEEFAANRFNLLARVRGTGSRPGLVFSAHMDTLPPGAGPWTHPPYSGHDDGERIHGRGACDMKSGLAAMVAAAAALRDRGTALQGDLLLAFTGGESSNCLGARRLAEARALEGCGALLVSEPSSLDVLIAEKGALWLRASAEGVTGHVSAGPGAGQSAILAMTEALPLLPGLVPDGDHPLLGGATLNVGRIEGGSAINLIPDRCVAELDFRLLPVHDPDAIERSVVQALGPGFTVERLDFKPAVATPADHPFVALCLEETSVARSVALAPKGVAYFSDACVLSPAFDLPMVIVGPGKLGGSGATDESVAIDDLVQAAAIYRNIARRMLT